MKFFQKRAFLRLHQYLDFLNTRFKYEIKPTKNKSYLDLTILYDLPVKDIGMCDQSQKFAQGIILLTERPNGDYKEFLNEMKHKSHELKCIRENKFFMELESNLDKQK